MKIILCGNIAGAGKDTAAEYLAKEYGFVKFAFADGIYKIAYEIFGMKDKDRWLLQQIGEKMRSIDPDIWCKNAVREAIKYSEGVYPVVITDMRRRNEYDLAVQNGFIPLRIVTPREIAIQRIIERDGKCDESLLDNDSEIGTRDIPMLEIFNGGTKEELYDRLNAFIDDLNQIRNWVLPSNK